MPDLLFTKSEWADILDAVGEVHALAAPTITILAHDTAEAVDALYGEASTAATTNPEATVTYAVIEGSVKLRPSPEYLTRQGLQENADIIVWIDRARITRWECGPPARTFVPDGTMYILYQGEKYNIIEARHDDWPTEEGGVTSFGILLTAKNSPK